VYVLERHIGRYFALKPGTKKAGMHRGEGFYHRDALAELHTADRCAIQEGHISISLTKQHSCLPELRILP
jgi:hypothetical protein